jgi:hypothetical protein
MKLKRRNEREMEDMKIEPHDQRSSKKNHPGKWYIIRQYLTAYGLLCVGDSEVGRRRRQESKMKKKKKKKKKQNKIDMSYKMQGLIFTIPGLESVPCCDVQTKYEVGQRAWGW